MQAKRSKNSGDFFGALASGEGITPPFAKKQSNTQNLESIRENVTLRNGKMQNLSNMEITESKVDSESRFRVLVLDSDLESKTDLQSHQTLESSLLDSRSHGYVPDSHHHLFAQKEKGFPLSPLSPAPKRIKRRCFCCAALVTRWVFFGNHKVYLLAGVPRCILV